MKKTKVLLIKFLCISLACRLPLLRGAGVCLFILVGLVGASAQNIGINATGAAPDASALLDLDATNKGFLITRVDTANIPTPAFGLMTLAPTDSCLYMYSGSQWVGMGGSGKNCSCNCASPSSPPSPPPPSCVGTVTPIVDVTNPVTGKIWMDRNLGAGQVATNSTDTSAYGCLYQWGRLTDGHEKRNSGTTTTLSATNTPGHGDFITISAAPNDWRSPQNNSLWQGVVGINNPCPTGYRIPTETELEAERLSWTTNDAAGAFASPLKLTVAGYRHFNVASIQDVGSMGYYWSSTVSATEARYLFFFISGAFMYDGVRAYGFSVRCIKD